MSPYIVLCFDMNMIIFYNHQQIRASHLRYTYIRVISHSNRLTNVLTHKYSCSVRNQKQLSIIFVRRKNSYYKKMFMVSSHYYIFQGIVFNHPNYRQLSIVQKCQSLHEMSSIQNLNFKWLTDLSYCCSN